MKSARRVISFLLAMVMVIGMVPAMQVHAEETVLAQDETVPTQEVVAEETTPQPTEAEQTGPECTGLTDCSAENHHDGCEKKTADEKAAADLVMEQIEALPSLEEMQAKPMADQQKDYEHVQSVYGAYCALTADQQALLPPAEEVFRPYFDYFNSLVSLIWSGSGTSSKPFLINTEQELRSLTQQVNSGNTYSGVYFQLAKDIALTSDWTPIGTQDYPFRGTFDGNGKTISAMTITGSYAGLFGYIGSGAAIKNVKLTEFSVSGAHYLAGLVAYADAGTGAITIADCSVDGSLRDTDETYPEGYLGGIVGYANAESGTITISGCSSAGTYSCDYNSGGIVGYGKGKEHSLNIRKCINNAQIAAGNDANYCGGIAGSLSSAEVESCINYGNVSGNAYSEDNGSSWLGGITGGAGGCVFNGCANYGAISTFFAGGITPSQSGGNVANSCLNAGKLTYSSDGFGFAIIYSYNTTNLVNNSYYLYGSGMDGAEPTSSGSLASGAVAHALRDYFGQTLGVDSHPVLLTSSNRVYKVTVIGEASGTFYTNYGGTVTLPELSDCAAYFVGDSKFDPTTPITRDYALAAKGYHNYVDGVCTYCGNEGVNYLDVGNCGESVAWTLAEDGTLRISGTGPMADYSATNPAPWSDYASVIDSVVISNGVTNVGDYACNGLANVASISLADSVTSIGDYAFQGLNQLTELTISDYITDIGDYAFASCMGVTVLSLGKRVKTIGDYAFYQCTALDQVSLPANVTTLGKGAFQGCTGIEYLWLSNGLETIGDYAWSGINVSYLTLPATVSSIGDYAFANCDALMEITFQGAAPQIGSMAFSGDTAACHVPAYDSSWASKVNKNYGGTLTWDIGSGTCGSSANWVLDFTGTLTISGTGDMYNSSSTSSIPWYSIREQIRSVVVSDGITYIGDYAFYGSSNLTSVTIADSVTQIGSSSYVGYGRGRSFGECTSLTQITIPRNVTQIAYSTFYKCTGLTAIDVASGNTAYSSADGVLYDRYKYILHTYPIGKTGGITIPSSVDEIAPYAFIYCENLEEITIPSGVSVVEEYAFGYCKNLSHITFEGSAPTIDSHAFYDVTATVDYPTTDTTWTPSMLADYCGTLTWNAGSGSCGTGVQWNLAYSGGYGMLTISGTGAMNDYTLDTQPWKDHIAKIRTVEVCDGVTYVGAYALCPGNNSAVSTSLTTVKLADSVTSIGNSAFSMCTKLSNLTLGNGVKTIGEGAFGSTAIRSVDFPNSLQTIGRNAFSYCRSLNSITFGNNLKTIGYTAFGSCSALQSVDLGTSVTTLEQSAFNGCSSLTKMVIPASVTSVGKWVFRSCTNLQYVEFQGNAPTFDATAFGEAAFHAYYLSSKSGWTSSKLANYGGTVTWGAISQRGTCGTNAEWFLDTAGNLLICGSGAMIAYSETNRAPWYAYRNDIKTVNFMGVTSVGNYAFADCPNLQVAIFDGNAPSFGANSFSGTTCEIWYPSTGGYWYTPAGNNYGGSLTWRKISSRGTCGTNAIWALDSTGTLVILGSGAMTAYSSGYQPWYSDRASIKSVIIGGKITSVSSYAFRSFTALQSVTIGESVTSINSYAFSGCSALKEITFLGSAPSITSNAFNSVTAAAYYPLANTSWTTSKKTNYGGTLTWEAVCTSHKETVAPAKEPTCTDTGLTEGSYCSLCNEVLVEQIVIPANGHYAIGPEGTEVPADTLEPDCTNAVVCTVCGEVAKAALGHRVLGNVPVPTDPLTITNSSSAPFVLTNGTYYSTNKSRNSYSELRITAKYACSLTLNYGVSSEEDYDKLYINVNSSRKSTISGEVDNKTLTLQLSAGDVVLVCYDKDEDTNKGQDRGWVTLVYDPVMVDGIGDVPAETAEPDCTNAVVCKYCQTVVKEALGHRVVVQLPEPETPFEVINTSSYPFTLTDGVYYSGNTNVHSSTSELQIKAKVDCKVTLNYGVSCEPNYDKLTVLLNTTIKATISGTTTNQTLTLDLKAGDVIKVRYSKDSSVSRNDDMGWVSVMFDRGPTEEIVPADTLEAGCEDMICAFCQAVAKEGLGHDWDDGVESIPATETTEGEMLHTCLRCDETKTEVIPVLEHTHRYEAAVTEPTCTEKGFTTYTCPCSDSYVDDYVDVTEHSYSNGFCTVCDGYESAVLNGDVYEISNAGQLYWFAQQVNAGETAIHGALAGDIVVNTDVLTAEGTLNQGTFRDWTPIGSISAPYSGTFDGRNFTVSGLYLKNTSTSHIGLFGNVSSGTIRNVGLVDSYFHGSSWVGGIAGACDNSSISGCSNAGNITGDYAGGVVGQSFGSMVKQCHNTGKVQAYASASSSHVGGVVGYNRYQSTVEDCDNTAPVTGGEYTGGIAGSNEDGSEVIKSFNKGFVADGRLTGGIVGYNRAIVMDCYNIADVSGSYRAGGIVGDNGYGTLIQCYNIGSVAGKNAGAILGGDYEGQILGCYYLDTLGDSGTNATTRGGAEAKSDEEFDSGAVAYLLQGTREEAIWGQSIGTEGIPVLGGAKVCFDETSQTYFNRQLGDLDLDGDVDSDDLTLLARHVGGIEPVAGKALLNADVDGSGEVNSDDLTKHARYVGGIITSWDQD